MGPGQELQGEVDMKRWFWVLAALIAMWPMAAFAQDGNGDGAQLEPDPSIAMWGLIVGFLMPPIIAVLNRQNWPSATKAVCAFITCLVAAAGTAYLAGDLKNESDYVTAALTVFGAAMLTYHQWWKPSGIAPKIEAST